jgi:2,4-dienoyl-CoA reductase-like NADH-dependent reductase (Old Yellow Enzyme family)
MTQEARLFSPLTIRGRTLRNRLAVSPMCQYLAQDGYAQPWHLVHLGSRAVGGAGLVMVEATAVSPEGRISPQDVGLWDDDHIPPLAQVASFLHEWGAQAGIQLAHAGRKASTYRPWSGKGPLSPQDGAWETVAPSPIPFQEGWPVPRALSLAEVKEIPRQFAQAARRALVAGMDVVEIHAAHGYLLHQFLSPLSNRRTDAYGGDFAGRTRLMVETAEAVREVWPAERPLFVRLSCVDWVDGGWQLEDTVRLARILRQVGVDVVDCSSGGVVPARVPEAPGYMVPFAERVRREAGVATAAVGRIEDARQAEEILQAGKADLIMVARAFLRDPYLPLHWAQELGWEMTWPSPYLRARPRPVPAVPGA